MTLPTETLDELERLLAHASPGPWPSDRHGVIAADGALIAALRNNARALIAAARDAERLRAEKDGAYAERNKLVALLAGLFPSSIERHVGAEWEDDWRNVVIIDLPTGQVSWHVHDSEMPLLFAHVPRGQGRKWDGHSNAEKYARVAALAPQPRTGDADGEE